MTETNPLAVAQPNTKGAETFSKYSYQYHWALCRLLDSHADDSEYAIFVEYHEDVVFADSLDSEKAKFEFSQIKCKDASAYTILSLTKPVKNGNSVLGKLLLSSRAAV